MPTGIQETNHVPDDKVDQVMKGYKVDNPIKLEKIKEEGGLWTVRATFPEKETPNKS